MDRLKPLAVAVLVVPAALSVAGEPARGGRPPIPGAVVTSVHTRRAPALAATLRACRGRGPREWARSTIVVERVGLVGRTLSFRTADGKSLVSCDSIGVPVEGRRWCGTSTGALVAGRLRDPRLTLCQPRSGRPVGFIWVTPRRRAGWIGVVQRSRLELYRVAAGLPVRIASDRDVHVHGSSATFYVRQYAAAGKLLVSQTVAARVAG